MTKFHLFKCIDNHNSNSNKNLPRGSQNIGSNSMNIKSSVMQDFDYNTIDMSDLSQMKMPYINHNRRIFANSDKDLIDILLFDKNLQTQFLEWNNTLNPNSIQ